jgi:hypothetical protein
MTASAEKASALPAKLVGLGYSVTEVANGERLTGGGPYLAEEKLKREGYAITAAGPTMQVDRYEVTLPSATPMKKRPA